VSSDDSEEDSVKEAKDENSKDFHR
jgi:hypothetical protein